jgi:ABC-type amino acid transport substrate-binding protein
MTAFPIVDRAIDALIAGEVDAVVGDAPMLDHYARARPKRDVRVVGELFEPEKRTASASCATVLRGDRSRWRLSAPGKTA